MGRPSSPPTAALSVPKTKGTLRPLNEVKLLVVGREAVGKTSLLRYLIDEKPRDPNEKKTEGTAQREKIEINKWSPERCPVQLNVWDFGGQQILRDTHRLFLTERSLYLLVLEDRRQDDHRSVHEWMKTIRNRGGNSPVIVVINKSDKGEQSLRLDESTLSKAYGIDAFLRTSCDPDKFAEGSIAALRQKIVAIVTKDERFRHIYDPVPASWLAIKTRVGALAGRHSVLEHADFVGLCKDPGEGTEPILDEKAQHALLCTLHELGTIVAHGLVREEKDLDREEMAARRGKAARPDVTLLDPNWLTGAIYRVLEKASSADKGGEFLREELAEWLDPDRYPPERYEFILDMMKGIGLCFRLPNQNEERYLVPQALPGNRPSS